MKYTVQWCIYIVVITFCCLISINTYAQNKLPLNAKENINEGNVKFNKKDFKKAQEDYTKALTEVPNNGISLYNLGNTAINSNEVEEARALLQKSIPNLPNNIDKAKAYHNIGNTYMKEEKWKEAVEAYKASLKLNPHDAETKYNLAYANIKLKKQQEDNKNNKDNKDNQKDKKERQDEKDKTEQDKQNDEKGNSDKNKDQQGNDQDKKNAKEKDEQNQKAQNPSKLSQQQADNILNALRQEEKKLQNKKGEVKSGNLTPKDKDW